MKNFNRTFLMMILLFSSSMLFAQVNVFLEEYQRTSTPDPNVDYSPMVSNVKISNSSNRDTWSFQFNFPTAVGGGEAGAESDGQFIFTTKWNGAYFYQYNLDGTYVGSFTCGSAVSIRDLAYAPSTGYFYGAAATTKVYEMDFYSQTVISTINAPTAARAIAYNDDNDSFYCNNWSTNITEFDRTTGAFIGSFPVGTFKSYYGFAYDNWKEGGPYLWGFSQYGSGGTLVQMDLATGEEVFNLDVYSVSGVTGFAGGLFTQPDIVAGTVTIGGCVQNTSIFGFDLAEVGATNLPPVAVCQNVSVVADGNCEGLVTPEQVDNGSYDPDGDPITFSLDPAGPYPLGETTVTLTVEDDSGETDECTATVSVVDATPPVINTITSPIVMWPANHQYVNFMLTDFVLSVSDNCASLTIDDVNIVKATSDEPEDATGGGDGNTKDDMVIADDCKSIQLRKERSATGNGRVYTVYLELDDGNGNTGTASCLVHVPHNNGGTAIDDGAVYEVLGECGFKSLSITANENSGSNIELMNYPNPFNNSTTLVFSVSEANTTTLKVYNMMSQEVVVLYDGYAEAGQDYEIIFSAEGLPEGLYICHIQSRNENCTNRMLLVR